MSRGWKRGSTRRWRDRRAQVLLRDHYRCQLALPGVWSTRTQQGLCCEGVATQVHHIHGKSSACVGCRTDQLDHLQAACRNCNLRVGSPTKAKSSSPRPKPMTRW